MANEKEGNDIVEDAKLQADTKPKEEHKEVPSEEGEVAALKDRLLRLAAEFDNYKKKIANDIKVAKDLGKAELIVKLLSSLDEFELAFSSLCNNKEVAGEIKGIELVFSNIYDTLKGEGLKEIEAKGKYDPYRHEVMLTKPSDKDEGTILEVIRKGYLFKEILLRPSSVIISSGRSKAEDKKEEEKK